MAIIVTLLACAVSRCRANTQIDDEQRCCNEESRATTLALPPSQRGPHERFAMARGLDVLGRFVKINVAPRPQNGVDMHMHDWAQHHLSKIAQAPFAAS